MSGQSGRVLGILAVGLLAFACCGCFSDWLTTWQALVVGAVAACLAVAWLAVNTTRGLRERGPAQATAAAHLDAVVAQEYPTAHGLLTEERRGQMTPAEFSERYAGNDRITDYTIDGTTIVGGGGQLRAEVRGQVRFLTGEVAPLLVLLVREADGRWRVADSGTGRRW
ncbi:hypothetical protein [Plantactinospora sonchi]|uniref:DUF4878 domain-containing protein n=1 Tax=Plantactinospora sonchi TaxID=1544735 RepID=A0ABU7RNW3_9ACTN